MKCLQHLERQTHADFEVVVVDDGSTDTTPDDVETFQRTTSLSLRYLRQANAGPAAARNRAVTLLNAPVCLMIGDDILPEPHLVEQHLNLHRQHQELTVAGLGLTQWDTREQTVTPFMHWLDSSGMQFAYADLIRGELPDWRHFYTSNLSLKTEQLRRHPFNEAFTEAAMEDLEMGLRLEKTVGLQVIFLPRALGRHVHPTSVQQACKRLVRVGAAAFRFGELWPEYRRTYHYGAVRRFLWSTLTHNSWMLAPLRGAAAATTLFRCPNRFMELVLRLHFGVGYRSS